MPNRMFMSAATSYGYSQIDPDVSAAGLPMKSIYESIHESGNTFKFYFSQLSSGLNFINLRKPEFADRFRPFEEFFLDV